MVEIYDSRPYLILYEEIDLGTDIEYKLIRNKTLVYSEKVDEFKYEVPSEVIEIANKHGIEYKPCFNMHEGGGGLTHRGHAAIIAGLSGKRLRPFFVERRGHLANSVHAHFSIPVSCIYIACNSDDFIEIIRVDASLSHNIIEMHQKMIWRGQYDCLPKKYSRYADAVAAAYEKRHCYHCRTPHFITE